LGSTGLQAAQERRPKGAVLAVADGKAEDLAAPIRAHPGGHHDGLGDHPAVDAGFAVGRVDEDVGEDLAGQRPVLEGTDLGVQVGADPADLRLAGPAVGTKGAHQAVHFAGGDAVQI
jgi:hypothetical protein